MIIAGPCSWVNQNQEDEIIATAKALVNCADYFRCKLWLGGTTAAKYMIGMESEGIKTLEYINHFIPTGTEVQTPEHVALCKNLSFIWVGARNCQNYGLLKSLQHFPGEVMIKRGAGITVDEMMGVYDVMDGFYHKKIYVIERGINTFDRLPDSRWAPDIKGAMRIKHEYPEVFERYIVDCSHSVGRRELVEPTYNVFNAIGTKHFMFEAMVHPETSLTDKNQIISTEELKAILCK